MIFSSRRKGSDQTHSWFGLHRPFDPKYRLVTSGLVQPWVLFTIRLIIALYCLVASIVHLILYLRPSQGHDASTVYIFFTRLNFIGVTSYFCAAAFHSGFFVLSLRRLRTHEYVQVQVPWYPLQKWGRFLQFLHLYLFSTVITFPLIVTVTYWGFLRDSSTFSGSFSTWSNISFHILNAVFLLIELVFGRVRLYLGYILPVLVTLALYLGMTYLVHDVDNIWVYKLLDPTESPVAAFIVGIVIAELVIYSLIWAVIHMRDWFLPRGRGVRVLESGDAIRV